MSVEKWLAAVTLVVCAVLALRMVLGPRFDVALRRAVDGVRRPIVRSWRLVSSRRRAARAADEAIRRARKLH